MKPKAHSTNLDHPENYWAPITQKDALDALAVQHKIIKVIEGPQLQLEAQLYMLGFVGCFCNPFFSQDWERFISPGFQEL
jgi:hypothetical protein